MTLNSRKLESLSVVCRVCVCVYMCMWVCVCVWGGASILSYTISRQPYIDCQER